MKNFYKFFYLVAAFPFIILNGAYGDEKSAEELFYIALEEAEAGNYQNALELLDDVLDKEPENISALTNKASLLINLKQFSTSIQTSDKILELNSTNIDALNNKGVALVNLERYTEALDVLSIVLEQDPWNKVAIMNMDVTVDQLGKIPVTDSKYIAYIQIELRDSSGFLVGYYESERITVLPYYPMVDSYLDKRPITEIKTINGIDYELINVFLDSPTKQASFFGNSIIQNPDINAHVSLFSALHHGVVVEDNEHFYITWTILRPVD